MKIIIPTILSLLIILSAALWFFTRDIPTSPEDISMKDKTETEIDASGSIPSPPSSEPAAAVDADSSDTQPPESSETADSAENADNEISSAAAEIAVSVDFEDKRAKPETKPVEPPEPAVEIITEPEIITPAEQAAVQPVQEKSIISPPSEYTEPAKRIDASESDTVETPETASVTAKPYVGMDELSVSGYGKDDYFVAGVPEHNWPDSNRVRRELTDEIIEKYPFENFKNRKIENNVWDTGEQLTFSVDYGFYRAGTATMSVIGTEEVNGNKCYQIRTEARSNSFISSFYTVRDSVISYIDVDGIFSRRFEKKLREGKHKSDRIVDFYPNRKLALNTREKYAVTEVPHFTQDILSSLYLLRTFDLKVGKDETIDVYADGKVYPLNVIIHGIEKVKVPAGKFECFKVEPILKSEGIFRQKGRLIIWLTCDDLKLPVKMKSKVAIGSIASNLEKYSTGVIE
jgi:hypothetical protein